MFSGICLGDKSPMRTKRRQVTALHGIAVRAQVVCVFIDSQAVNGLTHPLVKILPIAERELRVASRRAGTYWLRFFVVAALIAISTWAFLVTGRLQPQKVGKILFYTLTGGVMFYSLLAGLRFTADCLSEEKREGTLGLLFLTDLRGYDVVVGKLLANSLAVFYCVLAVLPVLAVPLLMGGVEVTEFARLVAAIVNTLFFSLCAGMLASAISKSARVAISWTLLLLLLVGAGGPALGMFEWWLRHGQGSYRFEFLIPSPVFNYFAGVDDFYKRGMSAGYIASLVSVHLIAWMFLALASLIVRHTWQDKPATVKALRWRGVLQDFFEGDAAARHEFRTRWLNKNAFSWLATTPRQRALWTWTPLVIAAVAWMWGLWKIGGDWLNPGMYATTVIILGVTYKGMIGAEAARRMLEDRKIGAMELLLSTPLTVKEIVRGQRMAIQRQFQFPIIVFLVVGFVLLLAGARHQDVNANERTFWIATGLLAGIVFCADILALFWIGMWQGLSAKNPKHTFGATFVPIVVVPWVVFGLAVTAFALLPRELQPNFNDATPGIALWFVLCLIADFGFGFWARHQLLTKFRVAAAQRFQPRSSWWRKLFGIAGK